MIILVQNTAFDTANAGKENVAFVFVIEGREWFVVSASSLQVQNGLIVHPQSCEVFYSCKIVAQRNTIWSKSDELKNAFLKVIKTCWVSHCCIKFIPLKQSKEGRSF